MIHVLNATGTVHLKMSNMVNFILCMFYHNLIMNNYFKLKKKKSLGSLLTEDIVKV